MQTRVAQDDLSLGPRETVFPALSLNVWEPTRKTLHLFSQIVGKIRLTLHPKMNHWWHAPFYVSTVGWTTGVIPYGNESFEIEFDFFRHHLSVRDSLGRQRELPFGQLSVAEFYKELFAVLRDIGIDARILAKPYDPVKAKSALPFASDEGTKAYDPEHAFHYWRALRQADQALKESRAAFIGKCSPVHMFWHSFDLAVTRFSGRRAPVVPGMGKVDREAYSHEVISFGFWPGDDEIPEAAFYSYVYPEPPDLAREPLSEKAFWLTRPQGTLALLRYEEVRKATEPRAMIRAFLESTYKAGAKRAAWPVDEFELQTTTGGVYH